MQELATKGLGRRDLMRGAALLAAVLGVPLADCLPASAATTPAPSPRQRKLLADVCQLVIPRTGTAGAGEIGVNAFVILALAHGLEGARRPLPATATAPLASWRRPDGTLDHLGWLEAALDQRAGGDFLAAAAGQRAAWLAALDAEAYAPATANPAWRTLKALILTGYYTAEVGGAKELRFELVPGRWDPDVPVTPDTRAFSSDWTAVDFG